jgi:CRP-like cAMP-binding protein
MSLRNTITGIGKQTMIDFSAIQNTAILKGLDQSELDQLAAIADERETQKGERLFTQGESADTFFIAKRGSFGLTLSVRVYDEWDEFVVEEKGALNAFGWSCLVEPKTSIYSAYCISDGAVVTLPGQALQQLIETHEHLGQRISSNLNELIGERVRTVQSLWISELENSRARIDFWTHTDMTNRLRKAIKQAPPAVGAR